MARMFSFAFMPWPIVLMCTIENSGVDEDFEIMIERYKYNYFKVIKKRKLSCDQKNFLSSQLAHHRCFYLRHVNFTFCVMVTFGLIFYGRFILRHNTVADLGTIVMRPHSVHFFHFHAVFSKSYAK